MINSTSFCCLFLFGFGIFSSKRKLFSYITWYTFLKIVNIKIFDSQFLLNLEVEVVVLYVKSNIHVTAYVCDYNNICQICAVISLKPLLNFQVTDTPA